LAFIIRIYHDARSSECQICHNDNFFTINPTHTDLGMNPCLRNDRQEAEFMGHAMETHLLMLWYLQRLFLYEIS